MWHGRQEFPLPNSILWCYVLRNAIPFLESRGVQMIYLVYKMHLSEKSRRSMNDFWHWLEDREKWFYQKLRVNIGFERGNR